ncbi:MAG: hypothetical protein ACJ77Z_10915 [Thermoleophilaceae bacterium]|jgi:hypothetical protein
MSTKLWPLAALATVALIGAGCSNGSAENGNTGTGTASSSGATSSTSSAGTPSTGNGTTSSGATTKLTAQEKAVKFAECMRANGVPHFPDPDPKGDYNFGVDVSKEVWLKAVNACKALQPPTVALRTV